jgi:hypothetical protein
MPMSKTIEVPDALYEELAEAAAADGTTPLGWIAARLRLLRGSRHVDPAQHGQTLAERFAGLVGVVDSGGSERLAERHSEVFGEMLEEQRKAGRL